jgi:putative redox protein
MPSETVSIPTPGGHALSGSLELPEGAVRGAALYAHCFTCTKQSRAAVAIARALAAHGFACLRFDFTGLGESGGEFGEAGFEQDVADVAAAAKVLGERYPGPMLLVGHSLGGAAVLDAVDNIGEERIAAVATIGAPADVPHVLGNIKGDLAAIERDGAGPVTIGGRPFNLESEFLERTRCADLLGAVRKLRVPLMICHSPTDDVVGVENASLLFEAAKHPKSFLSLGRADHLLTDSADAEYVAGVIAAWAGRYMVK